MGKNTIQTRREFLGTAAGGTLGMLGGTSLLSHYAASTAAGTGTRPNILYIMTDQQFAEAMSCRMGKKYIHTPAMDSLAEKGMLFTRAYSPNPLCMPMRASLFTGRYPHETGVTKNANVKVDPAEFVCMGTYFKQAGYETAYFGKWHLCFDVKDATTHGFDIMGESAPKKLDHDAKLTLSAVDFIGQKHDKPFLLVASYLNPHNICEYARGQSLPCGPIGDAPPPEQCPPVPANLAPPLNEPDAMTMIRKGYHANPMFPVGNFTENDWRRLRWGYYRMIEKVDAEIGRILDALRKAGLEKNTLILLTSDHGDCAGAHRFNQKTVFYDESARVPLILSGLGTASKESTDKLVNIGIDILPTMLEYAGVPVPKKLPGRSLRALGFGQPVTEWRDHVVVENNMDQTGMVGDIRPSVQGRMVRTEHYKYCIYTQGDRRESLVDMEKDPGETKDLASDPNYRKVLLEHREILARFAREHNDPLAAAMLADDVKPVAFKSAGPAEPKKKRAKKA